MAGKGFTAGDMLSGGRRRTEHSEAETPERLGAVTPSPLAVPASPAESRYRRTTYYVTPEQARWARAAAQAVADDGSISASDVARLALDLARELDPAELRQRLVDRAWADSKAFPGRTHRGMPPRELESGAGS
jgi:hypothetical protein